jgi:hypothetical protein
MSTLFLILALAGLAATLATLFVGVFSMGRGGEFNKRNSNKLMRLRVILQGAAILFFVLYMLSRG